jgi:hypothetical protein
MNSLYFRLVGPRVPPDLTVERRDLELPPRSRNCSAQDVTTWALIPLALATIASGQAAVSRKRLEGLEPLDPLHGKQCVTRRPASFLPAMTRTRCS